MRGFALLFIVITSYSQLFECKEQKKTFVQKSNDFSLGLYSLIIGENVNKNIVISPLSVNSILANSAMGASGKTREEMFEALNLDKKKSPEKAYKKLMKNLYADQALHIANKIYTENKVKLNDSFVKLTETAFLSNIESLDFSKGEESAKTINDWVDAHTKHKIHDIVSADTFNQETQMILLNAVHFKGNWKTKFEEMRTRPRKFWNYGKEVVDVPTMFFDDTPLKYGYIDELKAKAIELPYDNTNMSMLIILPLEKEGLHDVVSNIKKLDLSNIMKQLIANEVWFYMPKFEIEYEVGLNEPLKNLGMNEMFSNGADFTNIFTGSQSAKVSDVIHKAFIKVNEEGTEAAAVTEVQFAPLSALPDFTVDRPFLFLLKTSDNQIVFMGQKTYFDKF